jgi:pimeloyl-ACP methyl ester carboxylesterase
MSIRFVNVGALRMRWVERGEGPPVIFLHGIPTSPLLWRYVLPELDGIRCLAWEMVGYGASAEEGRGRDISAAAQADYLAQWMDAIGVERAVLVGHDVGGGVAQIFAARRPTRTAGLVLTNSVCYDSWPIPTIRILRGLAPIVRLFPAGVVSAGLHCLMLRGHDDRDRARRAHRVHRQYYAGRRAASTLVRQIQSLDAGDTLAVQEVLPRLRIPVRIVWGAADTFQKISSGERLAEDLGAPLDRIDDGRHFVPEDHPDRIAAAVRAVVAEARSGTLKGRARPDRPLPAQSEP